MPRHPPLDPAPPEPAKLTPRERKQLVELLRKYGTPASIALIRVLQQGIRRQRGNGRPSKITERIGLANEIDELLDHYQRPGRKRPPLKQAMLYLYRSEYDGQKDQPDVQKWLKATKQKVLEGRLERREYLERMERLSENPADPRAKEARRRLTAL
jgi:hypothetical protein